jgi:hypothetical protein
MIQVDTKSDTCHATYHGLKVSARVHKNDLDQYSNLDDGCLQTEIRAMAQLRHPNIIGFLGASISSKDCIVVTEFTPFDSLRSMFLSRQAQQPAWRPKSAQALAWALDLARAVTYLHQSDPAVTHRDLRPETLLIAASGGLKLSGFGRCKMLAGQDRRPRVAAAPRPPPPAAADSPYAAPELLRDWACADAGVDIFATGMLIRFLRTGQDPPRGGAAAGGRRGRGLGGGGGGGSLGWGEAGRAVARACAEEAAERPGAEALAATLEAEAERRAACRLS